jgi:hypothetical protein
MSFRDAKEHIRYQFMLRLADAPFDPKDAKLIAEAGACNACEKRTGNQPDVFADIIDDKQRGGVDVCTDSTCYKAKVDVHWSRLKADAEAKGKKVIEGKDAHAAGRYGDKEHVDLDSYAYEADPDPEEDLEEGDIEPPTKTYRELLGDRAPVVAIARDDRGEVRELISRSDLPALLKDAGIKVADRGPEAPGKSMADREQEVKEQRELERLVTQTAREAALARLDDLDQARLWKLLFRLSVRVARTDAQREMVKLHEVTVPPDAHHAAALMLFADSMPVRALRDLTVEMLIAEGGGWRSWNGDVEEGDLDRMTGLGHAAELLGIDMPAIVAKVKGDLEAARTAKDEKKAKKGKQKKPKDAPPTESVPAQDEDGYGGDGQDREASS